MQFNPIDYPIALAEPARISPSEWLEHVPFGMTLVSLTQPKLVVELGAFAGVSYSSFCQAIVTQGLDCRAFAVDTWEGDAQSGVFSPEIFAELSRFNASAYGSFSTLMRCKFDDALPSFQDGTIDLLHIDGFHTYEAVRHDFESWVPKLSRSAVVVFHDIAVRHGDFGVWKFWEELRSRYQNFEFAHQHGLGIVAVGPEIPQNLQPLLTLDARDGRTVRNFYCQLGRRLSSRFARDLLQAELVKARTEHEIVERCLRDRLANQDWMLSQIARRMDALEENHSPLQSVRRRARMLIRKIYDRVQRARQSTDSPTVLPIPPAESRAA